MCGHLRSHILYRSFIGSNVTFDKDFYLTIGHRSQMIILTTPVVTLAVELLV